MKSLERWLAEYGEDHRDRRNQGIHRICVPLIFFTIVGFLRLLPFHIGDGLMLLALIWYATLGLRAFLLMLAEVVVALLLAETLMRFFPRAGLVVFNAIFAVAWVGQFWGHHLEGRRPSFLKDLQYLLIGPIWVWLGKHSK